MAPDSGVTPQLAIGAGDALIVQRLGNGARTDAGGEVAEDTTDDAVAVAEATTRFAILDPTAQATMGLGREVFQEEGIHGALEADMQF
nr:hypothetical protein [Acetobacter senegalensis]